METLPWVTSSMLRAKSVFSGKGLSESGAGIWIWSWCNFISRKTFLERPESPSLGIELSSFHRAVRASHSPHHPAAASSTLHGRHFPPLTVQLLSVPLRALSPWSTGSCWTLIKEEHMPLPWRRLQVGRERQANNTLRKQAETHKLSFAEQGSRWQMSASYRGESSALWSLRICLYRLPSSSKDAGRWTQSLM